MKDGFKYLLAGMAKTHLNLISRQNQWVGVDCQSSAASSKLIGLYSFRQL